VPLAVFPRGSGRPRLLGGLSGRQQARSRPACRGHSWADSMSTGPACTRGPSAGRCSLWVWRSHRGSVTGYSVIGDGGHQGHRVPWCPGAQVAKRLPITDH